MQLTFAQIKEKVYSLLDEGDAEALNNLLEDGEWPDEDSEYDEDCGYPDFGNEVEEVYSDCKGDGGDMTATFRIGTKDNPEHFFVTIEGRYSSWASNSYDEAFLSKPFLFTETRYERI